MISKSADIQRALCFYLHQGAYVLPSEFVRVHACLFVYAKTKGQICMKLSPKEGLIIARIEVSSATTMVAEAPCRPLQVKEMH